MVPGSSLKAAAPIAAAFFVASAFAQSTPPSADDVAAGKRIYTNYCARCHGLNMMTGSGAVFDLRTFPKTEKTRFIESVSKGKGAMPAWGGTLKDADLDLLWSYVSAPR